ncbi:AraC family transcriptional regulator [Mucilaginibacter terrigena]|uniref:AraC family transcriptional regulator n=1 Tax=Mucilaginibacter terrigena TaxID=2492395 RepID=A0A4Q5LQC8_9SPHI|nr:AraC family transcriptional regulator [Mucilaginibacter terrigena]RYU91635.1 AraC family transcriptional regulator [Mucilaginibacter terrigena]
MAGIGIFEQCVYGNGNRMGFSRFRDFEKSKSSFSSVAIKYVIEGNEHYAFNKSEYNVAGGKFLLINPQQCHDVFLKAENDVTGICLNIDTAIINDVYRVNHRSLMELLDEPEIIYNDCLEMHEQIYDVRDSDFGTLLGNLGKSFTSKGVELALNSEHLYFSLAEKLLKQQCLIQNTFSRMQAGKTSTKKELFKRIERAKELLESNLFTNINMVEIASTVAMSPFHFNRTFKQVYQVAPYQYVINKRLEKARGFLKENHLSVGEIAHQIGYADLFSFSKSFKKAFKISPTAYKANTR